MPEKSIGEEAYELRKSVGTTAYPGILARKDDGCNKKNFLQQQAKTC